ncbi:Hypothetical predicted protein [Cloeon dipterum]|uniref:Uncharacterized protein n=1 Tax=Cloeon dipterum TaxID=197152 RepID=A0A8S1CF04_9INSE|nr:Hypothetical predicted protein [Cloeon dipterum]
MVFLFCCCTRPSVFGSVATTTYQEDVSLLMSQYSVNLVDEARDNHTQMIERAEIANLVRSRMESLNLPGIDYMDVSEKRNSLSYVIINPSCDLKLEEGDIIYLIRPSPFSAQKTFERHNSRRKSNISFCGPPPGGSTIGAPVFPSRAPPLGAKSNSLSLPESPTLQPSRLCRSRSNSLRITDDILLRRSNSLRQGLSTAGLSRQQRRKSSLEDVGLALLRPPAPKIALNGSIGLEVTPPDDSEQQFASSSRSLAEPSNYGGDPQHLQGTIV